MPKFIHITKPSWAKVYVAAKGTLCGRLAGPLARTSDAAEATCPRCIAEAVTAAPVAK